MDKLEINQNFVGFQHLIGKLCGWTENNNKINVNCRGIIEGITPGWAWIVRKDNNKIVCIALKALKLIDYKFPYSQDELCALDEECNK